MLYKFKISSTIPVVQYGNIIPTIELEGEDYDKLEEEGLKRIKVLWNKYSETPLREQYASDNSFEEVVTFTGETILYNKELHQYATLDGVRLLGGSTYAKQFEKPFDKSRIIPPFAKKHNVSCELVEQMWADNSDMSKGFGIALHKALENWFRYNKLTCYKLPKHPVLFNALNTFPLKGEDALPEIMVSDVKNHRVGQIDNLIVTDKEKKQGYLIDYKSDAEIKNNLVKHFNQMSFYADILKVFGWEISRVEVWNYTDKWEKYVSEVLPVVWK
jgi:hypothetical protein